VRRCLLVLLLVLAGCGGEGSPEKDAYERDFNAAREAFSERARDLEQPSAGASADVRADAGEAAAAEIARFVDDLEALEPPADVAGAHDDLTAAFRETADLTAAAARATRAGDDGALRDLARRLSDSSEVDKRAEDAVQVLVEAGYVLDLDFDLGR
jgi:hypothetical protein